ncbi:MAG TPA: hypothetical protein PLF04_06020 [Candidatus Fermentibacter daniensis]|jgi:hypothetical protein|nr:MAG: hypothetical protein AO394_06335 [Candidatus Fermentibacter daniensis]MBP7720527.1 hypothetical protein [Candidatus Fermentibacter sp.]OQC69145.1 MAG: hypothetical protein BWX47_01388 [candidate division Hyd24-12 bacterium ADurb.Bin004]KZD19874.1 MAG: hypothetical protein AO396_01540 [Candidatus Fermentibacter daniensis]HOA04736.1 hypothetical protein [Candidatus Fermentibacter daniensis]
MRKVLLALAALALAASAGTIKITNNTGGWDIYYAYISPADSDQWGNDWLGSDIMSDGETWEFPVANGTWDIRLVDEDGDDYILYNVPVSGTWTWNVTLSDLGENYYSSGSSAPTGARTGSTSTGGNAPVTIYNDLGNWTIYYVYCSSSSDSNWGSDRLGSSTISPGQSFTFNVPGGDNYDIYCKDEDGDTYSLYGVWIGNNGFYWSVDLGDID